MAEAEASIKGGEQVLLGQDDTYLYVSVDGAGNKSLKAFETSATTEIDADEKNYYLWTVTRIPASSPDDYVKYSFTNVATGAALSFDSNKQPVFVEDADDPSKYACVFAFKTDISILDSLLSLLK